jgi:hypothetical protein
VADHFGRGFATHQQGQRVHQDGLARAGFAREQVEPRAKNGNGVIDDGVVLSAQFDEHFSASLLESASNSGDPTAIRTP